ncbi:hypothetical protein HY419_01455, partial [candidate division WWE3 bacterium]|nr:hypothetical protein [candidate division WWE3 bacterium]
MPPAQKEIMAEMMEALAANIDYLREKGSFQTKIKNGQLLDEIGENTFLYEFELDFFQNIDSDSEVEIRIRDISVSGRVVAIDEKRIQIEIDANLGVIVPEAQLIVSSYYLLQLLLDRIGQISSGEISLTDLAGKTFNLITPQVDYDDQYQIPSSLGKISLDPSKEKALRLALGSEVSFIWGPPGTGKTLTIARVIEGLISRDLSVLLLSHTNVATDGALLYLVKHLEDTEDYQTGRFVRVGTIQKKDLLKYPMVSPDKIIEERLRPLKEEVDRLDEQISSLSKKVERSELILRRSEELTDLRREIIILKSDLHKAEVGHKDYSTLISELGSRLSEAEEKMHKYQTSNALGKLFAGTNLRKLSSQKADLINEREVTKKRQDLSLVAITKGKERLASFRAKERAYENELRGESIE